MGDFIKENTKHLLLEYSIPREGFNGFKKGNFSVQEVYNQRCNLLSMRQLRACQCRFLKQICLSRLKPDLTKQTNAKTPSPPLTYKERSKVIVVSMYTVQNQRVATI